MTRRPWLTGTLIAAAALSLLLLFLPGTAGLVIAGTAGWLLATGRSRDKLRRSRAELDEAHREAGRRAARISELEHRPFVEGPTKALTAIGDRGEPT
jgi:hypothetical protein